MLCMRPACLLCGDRRMPEAGGDVYALHQSLLQKADDGQQGASKGHLQFLVHPEGGACLHLPPDAGKIHALSPFPWPSHAAACISDAPSVAQPMVAQPMVSMTVIKMCL